MFIGFRATGKTTIGKLVAQTLGYLFLDTDVLIENRTGRTIAEIVEQEGWTGFRKREKEIIKELGFKQNLVIAVGGGAVLDEENVIYLKKNGIIIWLKAQPETILKRLIKDKKTVSQRPSLTGKSPLEEINEVLNQRLAIYQKVADKMIDTEGKTPQEIAKEIVNLLNYAISPA